MSGDVPRAHGLPASSFEHLGLTDAMLNPGKARAGMRSAAGDSNSGGGDRSGDHQDTFVPAGTSSHRNGGGQGLPRASDSKMYDKLPGQPTVSRGTGANNRRPLKGGGKGDN